MADIRCPMCGNINPEDTEVCKFCQARIKPLIAPTTPEEPKVDNQASESDQVGESTSSIPEWLKSLRAQDGISSGTEEIKTPLTSDDQGESEASAQDWLDGLRFSNAVEETLGDNDTTSLLNVTNNHPSPQNEEELDWLTKLRSGSERYSESMSATPEEGQVQDWVEGNPPDQQPAIEKPLHVEEPSESRTSQESSSNQNIAQAETNYLHDDEFDGILDRFITDAGMSLQEDLKAKEAEGLTDRSAEIGMTEGEKNQTDFSDVKAPDKLSEYIVQEQPQERGVNLTSEPENEFSPSSSARITQPSINLSPGSEDEVPVPEFLKDSLIPTSLVTDGLLGEDIQDWVENVLVQDTAKKNALSPKEEYKLEKAQIPVWLEGLRPIEAAAPIVPFVEEKDKHIESVGPLVGMRGALQAEPDDSRQKKTSKYSAKLLATEKQQANAAIIEQMFKSVGEPRSLLNRPEVAPLHVFRIVVFLILVVAILLPFWLNSPKSPLPQPTPETYEVNQIVNKIADNAPVLLGVDYEPGLSGELDAVSTIIIDHLMAKGAYLVLVSTNQNGPFQAERLLNLANINGGHKYVQGNEYINLGFIPGGQSGLLGLVQAPRQIFPNDLEGNLVWENHQLQNVKQLADFSLVLVLTENPDTARSWIEQVGPSLGETPLLMVVSAQAEPLVRPYVDANPKQVSGMVAGLAGGMSYERLLPRPVLSSRYWDSYTLSALTAVGLIFISGLVNMVMFFIAHKNQFGLV